MDYSFNANIAVIYGVNEAIFIQNLYWWIAKNEANGKHFYDGRYWTYNSMEAFTALFPFWTKEQVRHIIAKLKQSGTILTGNYNKKSFDRTLWYALAESVISVYKNTTCIWENSQMPVGIFPNGKGKNPTPIPDSKPDINTDTLTCVTQSKENNEEHEEKQPKQNKQQLLETFWKAYPKKKGKGNVEKWFAKNKPSPALVGRMLAAIKRAQAAEEWQKQGGQFIPHPTTWLNAKGWEDEDNEEPQAQQAVHCVPLTEEMDVLRIKIDENTTIDDLI